VISLKKNYIFIILVDLYASLSRFFFGTRIQINVSWYGSDRIWNTVLKHGKLPFNGKFRDYAIHILKIGAIKNSQQKFRQCTPQPYAFMIYCCRKSSWFNCKKLISLIIIRNKIERKKLYFFSFFWFGKNVISEISGRLLIGQNDSLRVLLLVISCIEYKKRSKWPSANTLNRTFLIKERHLNFLIK